MADHNHHHNYHMVESSPWPGLTSFAVLAMMAGLVKWLHHDTVTLLLPGIGGVFLIIFAWWRDVVRESTYMGRHTERIFSTTQWGMILFITSEVLFFLSFFWAFFHSSLTPTTDLGNCWPPSGVHAFNPFQIPLLNTAILLSSGATVTWTHHAILESKHIQAVQSLATTVLLGLYFTSLQAIEYLESSFSISDSVYGATFFVATGFHGLHVIIGTTFLMVSLSRMSSNHFSQSRHLGFEAAAWYWHFVDVVWLFLYVSIYWWGS